jgi:protocatechuate 3,4-dioxygenase beta subunit
VAAIGFGAIVLAGARPVTETLDDGSNPAALYAAAVAQAQQGDVESALARLQESFEAGHERPADALREPGLALLTEDAGSRQRFRELLRTHARQWRVVMVTPDEPGETLVVSGTILDHLGGPIPDALVYVYHTDARGIYSGEGNVNPRLFAFMRTGADGRYEYRTIRPAGYPGTSVEPHVHYVVSATGYEDQSATFSLRHLDLDRHDIRLERQVIDFETHVRPIVEPACAPCHFEGGKMYHELPFDRPETIRKLGTKLFSRVKDEHEQATIRAFLQQSGAVAAD